MSHPSIIHFSSYPHPYNKIYQEQEEHHTNYHSSSTTTSTYSSSDTKKTTNAHLSRADHPFLISLGSHRNTHHCSGTLISPSVILTAAHCFTHESGGAFHALEWVDIHRHDLSDNQHVVRVYLSEREGEDVKRHPEWDHETLKYDFALVFLSEDEAGRIGGTEGRIMMLNDDSTVPEEEEEEYEEYDRLVVMGWGMTSANPYVTPDVPHVALLDYVSNEECMDGSFKWPRGRITESMMCAFSEDHHSKTCNIDSGGPIIKHTQTGPVQVGVSSFVAKTSSHQCSTKHYPTIFARVSSGIDWIRYAACHRKNELCNHHNNNNNQHEAVHNTPHSHGDSWSHSEWYASTTQPSTSRQPSGQPSGQPSTSSQPSSQPSSCAKSGKTKSTKCSKSTSSRSKSSKSKSSKVDKKLCMELFGKSKSDKSKYKKGSASGSKSNKRSGGGSKASGSKGSSPGGSDGGDDWGESSETMGDADGWNDDGWEGSSDHDHSGHDHGHGHSTGSARSGKSTR